MTKEQIFRQIKSKGSFLCVGLDSELAKLPAAVGGSQVEFNKRIIDATAPYTVCYKPNLAFYEENGVAGYQAFVDTCQYIRERYPEMFIIADAKRGDIGNTSKMYAQAFFEENLADAVTLSPYMGRDTVLPFFDYKDKWAVLLALTSNPSAADFEMLDMAGGEKLYEKVLGLSKSWGSDQNTMYVVGATQASMLESVRRIVPDHFLLVPGIGAQGGSLEEVAKYGMNSMCGLLVNSSRNVIFASPNADFAEAAARAAAEVAAQMKTLLDNFEA